MMLAEHDNLFANEDERFTSRPRRVPPEAVPAERTSLIQGWLARVPGLVGMAPRADVTIRGRRRRFALRDPLFIEFEQDGKLVFASSRLLPFDGDGDSQEAALRSFYESFEYAWEELVESDPADLSEDARELAEALRRLVLDVENDLR